MSICSRLLLDLALFLLILSKNRNQILWDRFVELYERAEGAIVRTKLRT